MVSVTNKVPAMTKIEKKNMRCHEIFISIAFIF